MKLLETLNSVDLNSAFRQTLVEMGTEEAEAVINSDEARVQQIRQRMDTLAQYFHHCQEERRQVEEFFNNPNATTLDFLASEGPVIESTGDKIASQQANGDSEVEEKEMAGRKGGEVNFTLQSTTRGPGRPAGPGRGRGRRSRSGQYHTATELAPLVLTVLSENGPMAKYSDVQRAVRDRLEKQNQIKPQDLKPVGNSKTLRIMSQTAAVKRTLDKHGLIGNENGKVIITPAGIQSLKQGNTEQVAATA